MSFAADYLEETRALLNHLDPRLIDMMAERLRALRDANGRLFILGVGGSAANASHAVNDFRKLCHIKAYAPTDNVAELTARTNDEGWASTFVNWLINEQMTTDDAVLVLSVGGGGKLVSPNLALALDYVSAHGGERSIMGIVGRDGGHTLEVADYCILIPPLFGARITPHTEELQAVLLHLLVSHPLLREV